MIRSWLKQALLLDVFAEREVARAEVALMRIQLVEAKAQLVTERAQWKRERDELLVRLVGSPPINRNDKQSGRDGMAGSVAVDGNPIASPIRRMQEAQMQKQWAMYQARLQRQREAKQVGVEEAAQEAAEDPQEIVEDYLLQQAMGDRWQDPQQFKM
jgi:hypothetical protein